MPAHSLDPNDPKVIARLLVALLHDHKGEIRVKAGNYDNMERGVFLLVDFDKATCEIVMRCTTESGRAIVVSPEAHAWSKPPEENQRIAQGIAAQRAVRQRTVRSDEENAVLEDRLTQEATLAREASEGSLHPRFRTEIDPPAGKPRGSE
jgi:hypothetical protein